MKKNLTIFAALCIILVVIFGALPLMASSAIESQLRERLQTDDVRVDISSPLLFLTGGSVSASAENATLGRVKTETIELNGKGVTISPASLFSERVEISGADSLVLSARFSEQDLREMLMAYVKKLNNAEVKVTGGKVYITSELKLFGRPGSADLTGEFRIKDGALYLTIENANLKSSRVGRINLSGALGDNFGDILLVPPEKVPLDLTLTEVRPEEGAVWLTGERK